MDTKADLNTSIPLPDATALPNESKKPAIAWLTMLLISSAVTSISLIESLNCCIMIFFDRASVAVSNRTGIDTPFAGSTPFSPGKSKASL